MRISPIFLHFLKKRIFYRESDILPPERKVQVYGKSKKENPALPVFCRSRGSLRRNRLLLL